MKIVTDPKNPLDSQLSAAHIASMLSASDTAEKRDRTTGRYVHRNFALVCRCGHTLGQHTAATVASRRDCLAEGCDCECFRKVSK